MENSSLAQRIARILYDKKAQDITVLHVGHLTVITDYMVIATGRSTLQVKALADDVDEAMAMEGVSLRAREGRRPLDRAGLRHGAGAHLPSGGSPILSSGKAVGGWPEPHPPAL